MILMPVFLPAGAAAAGIDAWLGEGAHVGMSAARASGLVWHGVLQGLCHAATMCSARWDSCSLGNVLLLLQMLAHCQPSHTRAVTMTQPRQTWCGVELLTAKLGWVFLGSTQLSPALEKRCLEMLQCGGFGVTKERRVCTLTASAAACSRLNSRFYLLGTGPVLNCTGTAAPLVLLLEGWRVRVTLLGSVGRWTRARSCAEHRVGEAHMPGCKHVRERDPGCLNNVKY